jgi:hypothetical protein
VKIHSATREALTRLLEALAHSARTSGSFPKSGGIVGAPLFQKSVEACQHDPLLAPWLTEREVEFGGGLDIERKPSPEDVVFAVIAHVFGYSNAYDAELLDEACVGLEMVFKSGTVPMTLVSPVPGLVANDVPISFEQGVTIDVMPAADREEFTRHGVIPPHINSHTRVSPVLAIVISYPQNWIGMTSDSLTFEQAREKFERVLSALRLLKDGVILSSGGYLARPPTTLIPGTTHIVPSSAFDMQSSFRPLTITRADIETVKELYTALGSINKRARTQPQPLAIAVRRFTEALARNRIDDCLVDLMIAAEALFKIENHELRFKLALRCAYYADVPPKRNERFELLKKAYESRSRIVHGREPILDRKVVARVEDCLRSALRKAVLAQGRGEELPDWDSLVLATGQGDRSTSAKYL